MRKISEALDLPLHFFLRPLTRPEEGVFHFRSTTAATKMSRSRAERRFIWLREIVCSIQRYVKFPKVNYPDFHPPGDPSHLSDEAIVDFATGTRRFWGLRDGPISDVVQLLENNGTILARHELASTNLDAFSRWGESDRTPYIILGTDKGSAVRSRYDVAHELGHLVLHRNVSRNLANQKAIHALMERQAHRFAGSFLLPERTFSADVYSISLDALRALKPKWKVSIAFMLHRASSLDLVNDEQARKLWINLQRRGWRAKEPLDEVIEPEEPKLLERSLRLLAEHQLLNVQDIAHEYGFRDSDIESLVGMSPGTLGAIHRPLGLIRLPSSSQMGMPTPPDDPSDDDRDIIQFPSRY